MKYPKSIERMLDENKLCIIIWHDKHGDWYFDATGREKWDATMLYMLQQRVEQGYVMPVEYWQKELDELDGYLYITPTAQSQIDSIQDNHIRALAQMELDQRIDNYKEITATRDETRELFLALETSDPVLAYHALSIRNDYEYERWDWEFPINAVEELAEKHST